MATIGATYHEHMARALPGQWGDTSKYNIDGACVVGKLDGGKVGDIYVGAAVQHGGVDAMGNKLIKPMAASGKAYGVAIRSHFQTVSKNGRMVYEDGSGINVMTEGRVWMLRDKDEKTAPTFGAAVKLDENGFVKNEGSIDTAWTFTGDYTAFGDLQLVEVQVQ
ncbi:hypothetical protein RCIP0096_00006 [Klebsiella phage RCIP0096]